MKVASQMMKTQIAINWIGALIDGAPSNIIVLEPNDKLAKRVSSRFDKAVQVVEPLRRKVATRKSRDQKNTWDTKEFHGGTLWFLTGRSPANLAEASARYLVIDEIDRLMRELKGEGDPVGIVRKRLTTYGNRSKELLISSPTEEGNSRIDDAFREGNQCEYHVPCPHCEELHALEWDNVRYDLEAKKAWMVCPNCGGVIEEHNKTTMLPDIGMGGKAQWVEQIPFAGEIWSCTLSALYLPLGWDSWLTLAKEYDAAKEALSNGDHELMRVFYNTRLALVYSDVTTRIAPAKLREKAEAYQLGIIPNQALVVTAAVDVQGNRLEVQILGWGPGSCGLEAWVVGVHVLFGDPTLPEVWKDLDSLLLTPIRHQSGTLITIRAVAIDSGDGDNTQEVYEFCRSRRRRIASGQRQDIIAIKGANVDKDRIISRGSKLEYTYRGKPSQGSIELFTVYPKMTSDWFMTRLALEDKTAIHTSTELPLEFYEQLLAEVKTTEWVRGRRVRKYRIIKNHARNEQHDLMRYNVALAHYLGIDKYTSELWEQVAMDVRQVESIENQKYEEQPQSSVQHHAVESVPIHHIQQSITNNRHQNLLNRLRSRR